MKKRDLVTVIVLTYNKFENLNKNLNSIYSQSYENIEIIISDDGSKNFDKLKMEKLLKNIPSNIKNYKIICNKYNLGTVKNFNNAIRASKGKFIVPLSQDDIFYEKDSLKNIISSFSDDDLIVTGIRVAENEEKNINVQEFPKSNQIEWISNSKFYEYLIYNGNILSGASTYYRKEIFEKYGYFDEEFKLLEDLPFFLNILRNKEKIKFIPVKTITYGVKGVSSGKIVNKILQEDYKKMFLKEARFNKGFLKRYLLFSFNQREYSSKIDIIKLYILNLDILFFKIIVRLFSIKIFL